MPKLTYFCEEKSREMMNYGNNGMPSTPTHTGAERRKCTKRAGQLYLYAPGDTMGRGQTYQSINFDEWVHEWNNRRTNIENGVVEGTSATLNLGPAGVLPPQKYCR